MVEIWHPDVDDVLLAHEYASFVSKVKTEGFHMSRKKGIETTESIIDESKEKEDPSHFRLPIDFKNNL